MIETTIHDVKKIEIDRVSEFPNFVTRKIVITTKDEKEATVTLFGDKEKDVEISVDETKKF